MLTHRFAIATAVATYILLIIGGLVHPTGSNMGCPDWPTCNGEWFPPLQGAVLYEHGHRYAASTVGVMTLALAVFIWRRRPMDSQLTRLGLVAFAWVVVQGLLGAWTVLVEINRVISVTHLAVAFGFFVYLIYICFRTWPGSANAPSGTSPLPRQWVLAAVIAVFVQVLLGGAVRHLHAGMACGNAIPFCGPSQWLFPTDLFERVVNMTHRWCGVVVMVIVTVASVKALRATRGGGWRLARAAALIAPTLTALQIVAGLLTVQSGIGIPEVSLHMAAGAALLANMTVLYYAMGPLMLRTRSETAVPA